MRERYCIEKGDACVALGWHDLFYMFYPVSIGKRLVLMRRWVGAPTTSFPTSVKRVDVRQTAEITACARPNAPVDCVLVLTIGCHDQGYCRDFRNGMFYTNELLARPNEYTEYRVLQQKWPHWGIIYEVRHCSRDAADCAGRDWLPKVANYGRGDDGILIVRQMDVPALGGFGASE